MARLQLTYVLFMACCLLAGCVDDPWMRGEVDGYVPVYSADPMLKQISFQPPRKTVNGGKLFTAGTNVLQEELDSGLHVISYQDPAHPVKTGFLRIPGFQVAAIEGDYLYANNYNDLIAIPLNALSTDMTIGRVANVWKQMDYPTSRGQSTYFECPDPTKGAVVGWRQAKINNPKCRTPMRWDDYDLTGRNRNHAGLIVSHSKLYLVNPESLVIYSLASPGQPMVSKSSALSGVDVDTIFLLNNELAVTYSGSISRFDTASLGDVGFYNNLSLCMKLIGNGDDAYAISSGKYPCGGFSPYMIKYKLRKDTISAVEVNRLQIGEVSAFAMSGNYIYTAGETGMVVVNIAASTMERVGDVTDGSFSDIVVKGNLLFLHGREKIVCYSVATSPVSPILISKLAY
jgi:hypothetical protein